MIETKTTLDMKKHNKIFVLVGFLFLLPTIVVAQGFFEAQKIVASDRDSLDLFGFSVAISGDYAIVGAYNEDDNLVGADSLANAGAAYIYERDANGNWSQAQKIIASDRAEGDLFGYEVAISGDYAIVGAYEEDEDALGADTKNRAGSAYIFERSGGTWSQVQKIVASDRNSNDRFGFSVSISGDYAIVGAYNEDHDAAGLNSKNNAGSAYIFSRSGGGIWSEQQKIVASDRSNADVFGFDVAISGNYALIGAFQEDHNVAGTDSLNRSGSAYFFERDTDTDVWSEVYKAVASDRDAEDRFARSVAIDADYAVIGAYFEDHNTSDADSLRRAGSAYIYERTGGSWSQTQKIVASDRAKNDNFGNSVAISGDLIVIGAPKEDHDPAGSNSISNSGSLYVFERGGGGTWSEVQKIKHSDRNNSDLLGTSVAISGEYIFAGLSSEDDDVDGSDGKTSAGSAYLFERAGITFSNGTWEGGSGASGEPTTADTAKDIAIIFGDATISAAAEGNKLHISNGTSLTIETTGSLVLADSTRIHGAEALIIESDATATGNFVDNGIRYLNSGSAKVERYLDANSGNNLQPYHFIGSPVNNHPKFNDTSNLFGYRESDLTWLYHADPTDGFTNFSNGVGYAIRYTTDITKSFSGELNTGNYDVSITATGAGTGFEHFNLLANPYPSSISANDLVSDNSGVLESNVYFWNGVDYALYNTSLSAGTAGSLGVTPDGNIAVGQGFYVNASSSGTVTFTNSMRGTDSDIFYKKVAYPQLRLLLTGEVHSSDILITGHQKSTAGKDDFDGLHMKGNADLSMSSLLDGLLYDIQSIPDLKNHTFDLAVSSDKKQEVRFHIKDLIFLEGMHIYLEDKKHQVITDITENAYNTLLDEGEDQNRFKLRIQDKVASDFHVWISDGYVNAFVNDEAITGTVTLSSIDGKLITRSRSNYIQEWNALAKGIYILNFDNEGEQYTQKIVKF